MNLTGFDWRWQAGDRRRPGSESLLAGLGADGEDGTARLLGLLRRNAADAEPGSPAARAGEFVTGAEATSGWDADEHSGHHTA